LVGHDVNDVNTENELPVTLCWQAMSKMSSSHVTFVHLLDSSWSLVSQVDEIPGHGAYPTTGWLPGEYLCFDYNLPIPENLAQGQYAIEVGVYDSQSLERLPLNSSSEDQATSFIIQNITFP
jgi:hypothetical protein